MEVTSDIMQDLNKAREIRTLISQKKENIDDRLFLCDVIDKLSASLIQDVSQNIFKEFVQKNAAKMLKSSLQTAEIFRLARASIETERRLLVLSLQIAKAEIQDYRTYGESRRHMMPSDKQTEPWSDQYVNN